VYGCRTTTDAADADASNDVSDAEEHDVVGRYARYDEVGCDVTACVRDCDLLQLHLSVIPTYSTRYEIID